MSKLTVADVVRDTLAKNANATREQLAENVRVMWPDTNPQWRRVAVKQALHAEKRRKR